ncbi:YbjN domain-containing protein [Actinotalea sp. BY-33]|uniref:YbjN domain-containing protein n=1 Tax=Actinotalea soli TaxID=2819234 RepID=A0A939LXY7_9CELL|nr:YbjN domain-containing protein [Actinotalea soli]MBO1753302.1 YbjN domain-containing protein [Actinotalea soli]
MSAPGRGREATGADQAARRPSPVDLSRVEAYLVGRGYHVAHDEDGDLTGTWDGDRFWFLLLGEQHEILQVRGRWHRTLPAHRRAAALLAVNDWNRERIWPKVYLRDEDEGSALYTEVSVDLEHGVTDDQLGQLVACGLGTGVQFFAALGGLVPED